MAIEPVAGFPPSALPLKIGISACLLGHPVRYNGRDKRNSFLTDRLGRYVEWIPVCPEVEVGMTVPREPVFLVQTGGVPHMIGSQTGKDWTPEMNRYVRRRIDDLANENLCGYVLKAGSPSCGLQEIPLHTASGELSAQTGVGRGLFASALLERLPALPIEEEERLQDPFARDNFLERIFALHRLRHLFLPPWTVAGLTQFHAAHKLQLMTHGSSQAAALGRLVAAANDIHADDLRRRYEAGFLELLREPVSRGRHVNVLQHILGYFKKNLHSPVRSDLLQRMHDYAAGQVPWLVPITLLREIIAEQGSEWLRRQTYLKSYPDDLRILPAI